MASRKPAKDSCTCGPDICHGSIAGEQYLDYNGSECNMIA